MTDTDTTEHDSVNPEPDAWAALSAPFADDEHELLPKQISKADDQKGRCEQGSRVSADGLLCGGWHARSVHLHYIGHAGVTLRLGEVDPLWSWEPMALTEQGLPLASDGGMWIKLTVLGVTRIGFGDAQGKGGPNAVKETIGDAIRNAAMRFGVGTYLWSKSERSQAIRTREGGDEDTAPAQQQPPQQPRPPAPEVLARWTQRLAQAATWPHGSDERQAIVSEVWAAAGSSGLGCVVEVPESWRSFIGSSRAMLGDLARAITQDARIVALPEAGA